MELVEGFALLLVSHHPPRSFIMKTSKLKREARGKNSDSHCERSFKIKLLREVKLKGFVCFHIIPRRKQKTRSGEKEKHQRERKCADRGKSFFSSVVAVHSTSLQFVLKRRSNQTWFWDVRVCWNKCDPSGKV
jgi:hypothetical protein